MKPNFQGFWGDKTFLRAAQSAADSVGLQEHKRLSPSLGEPGLVPRVLPGDPSPPVHRDRTSRNFSSH